MDVTTNRTVETAPAYEIASVAEKGSAERDELEYSTDQVIPPSVLPRMVAPVASELRVKDLGWNGCGIESCTHSPAIPAVDDDFAYKPPEYALEADVQDCDRF